MKCPKLLFLVVIAIFIQSNEGYRILCVLPFNGKSHFVMFEALCQGLAKRGHQIDVISHFPSKKPIANYTDIVDLSGTRKNVVNNFSVQFGKNIDSSLLYYVVEVFGNSLCELLGHEKMQQFINNPPNDPPYDLVIVEYFGSTCYLGFGPFLKVPVVIGVTYLDSSFVNDFMGSPMNYAFFSGAHTQNAVVTTFFDRLWNFVTNFKVTQLFYYYTSRQTEGMRKYLGQDLPHVRELEKQVSLALMYGHHSLHGIRPVTPSILEIGGLHVEADKSELTPELKSWLDSAKHGVVYFTFGSLLNIETLPQSTILGLYASFAKISPVKVLMKCANTTRLPPGLPSNMITLPWIPQVAVFRHRNTRIFITHGGLMGTVEAIYHGIPMIGIPVFADQAKNVNILVHKNVAVQIHVDNITESSMDAALNTVLHDPRYRESAREMSKLFRDRPMSIMDTAAYWIEYVIRNGPDSLKSPAVDMPWWKLNMVDVFAFLTSCLALGVYFLTALLKFALRRLYKQASHQKKKLK